MLAEIQTLLHSRPAADTATQQDRNNLSQAAAALAASIAGSRTQMASRRAHAHLPDFSRLQPPVNPPVNIASAGDFSTNARMAASLAPGSALAAATAGLAATAGDAALWPAADSDALMRVSRAEAARTGGSHTLQQLRINPLWATSGIRGSSVGGGSNSGGPRTGHTGRNPEGAPAAASEPQADPLPQQPQVDASDDVSARRQITPSGARWI